MQFLSALVLGATTFSFSTYITTAMSVPQNGAAEIEARGVTGSSGSSVIPTKWLESRDPLGAVHLGDDGVLRQLTVRVPDLVQRDEQEIEARWSVTEAIPLAPQEIKRWIDMIVKRHPEQLQHLEETFAGIDGRDVHPRDHYDPHPKLLTRSPGTMSEMREIQTRSLHEHHYPLQRRADKEKCHGECKNNADCKHKAGNDADAANHCKCATADAVKRECYWTE